MLMRSFRLPLAELSPLALGKQLRTAAIEDDTPRRSR